VLHTKGMPPSSLCLGGKQAYTPAPPESINPMLP
jgi:hypothetical protein